MNSARYSLNQIPLALLAGGLATRLRPLTETIPKTLIDVAGKPFVEHQLALLKRNGIVRVVLCVGYQGEQIETRLGDGERLGMELCYSYDGERLLGTGGSLRKAAPLLGELFWVMYGDSYLDIDYAEVFAHFVGDRRLGLMTVFRNQGQWDRSNIIYRDGRVWRYDKKVQSLDMMYIDYGLSLLRREALERIPEGQPYDLADLYAALVAEGQMAGYEIHRRFYEIGSPEGLEETRRYLAQKVT